MGYIFSFFFFISFAQAHVVQRPNIPIYQFPVEQNISGIQEYEVQILAALLELEFGKSLGNQSRSWTEKFSWKTPYLGAGSQFDGHDFIVLLYGGMVRARYMNLGALSAILCHELGHKLGGAPYQKFPGSDPDWSSAEGQADTFAAQVCLPRLYDRIRQMFPHFLRQEVEPVATWLCLNHKEKEKCQWVVTSGVDFIQFGQVYFDLDVPMADPMIWSQERPTKTLYTSYPSYQCRMDIYKSAALADPSRQRCWYVTEEK